MKTLRSYLAIIVATALLAACDRNVFYSEYTPIDEQGWLPTDSARFEVQVDDTVTAYNFLFEVRNSITYPYSNTFLFVGTTFPDGSVARDTVEFPLAAPSGEWYGKRTGRYVDTRCYFRRNARFPMPGTYRFSVANGMRDSAIAGIHDVGLRIEYSKMNPHGQE